MHEVRRADGASVVVTAQRIRPSARGGRDKGRRSRNQVRAEARAGYFFLLPNFVGFAVFSLLPIFGSLAIAFTRWNMIGTPSFTGLANFSTAIGDALFWKTLGNSAYYALVAVPIAVFIAFWLALLLNRGFRGTTIFRTIYFLPYVTLTVAVAIVWTWIYNPDVGGMDALFRLFGIDGPRWLESPTWAMPAIIIMSDWQGIGYPILIFLAALQGVPDELYESARVDGANFLQRVRYVTVPGVAPVTVFILVTSLIGAMQGFDQFYIMTKGGPAYSTTTLVMYIYQQGFEWFNMGYASALAIILFLVIFLLTLIVWRIGKPPSEVRDTTGELAATGRRGVTDGHH